MIAQGFDLTKNAYNNRFQPYVAYWGAGWTLFFVIINGFAVFWNFNATGFLTACMHILVNDLFPWLIFELDPC
jgi:amino acid transporter